MSALVNKLKTRALARVFVWGVVFLPVSGLSQEVDLIVYGDHVLTMDGNVISDGAVAIDNDIIVGVGSREQIDSNFSGTEFIPGEGRVVMPGLINGHTHSAMTLFRGMVDDLDLSRWLNDYVFPMESRFVDPDFIRIGSTLACFEMIRSGTTTFVDMYFYPEVIARVVDDCGLRAVVTSPSIDVGSPGFEGWQDSFAAAKKFVSTHQGKYDRVTPGFAPHAPYTVSAAHLKEVAAAASTMGAPVSMHLAEARFEVELIQDQHQLTPVQHVSQQGLFDVGLIAAHVVHPSSEDIALMAARQVGAIHNPTSNLKVATGTSPVVALLDAGVAVGLGTDGAASNNDLDLWEEIRLAALLHKQETSDPTAVPAKQALAMATSLGARAIDMSSTIGRLKVSMQADLIQVDLSRTELLPLYNVISHLVYASDAHDVVTTIVAGEVLMRDRKVLTIDEPMLRREVLKQSARIANALE